MVDRRQFVLAGAAALTARATHALDIANLPFGDVCARIEDYPRFLTRAELRQRLDSLQSRHASLLTRRVIGSSRHGEPIELISVGGGRRSALVVAGLHANEQVGGLAAEFLLTELCRDDGLRQRLGFTWHFINPIDPDGMRLNEGWLRAPLTLESYLGSMFRPALARQPEYTFPLQVGALSFKESPPENLAWRKALELTKPALQYTQHNADYGGAFFLTSAANPALESQLQAVPSQYGVALSRVGEPMAEVAPRSEGVFALPLPTQWLNARKDASADQLRSIWSAGDSSTSYASRYDTFSLSAEVPMWDDARVTNHGPSDVTVGSALREFARWNAEAMQLIQRWQPTLTAKSRESELIHSLKEFATAANGRQAQIEQLLGNGKVDGAKLSIADAATYRTTLRLSVLRPISYLAQLADVDKATASAAEQCRGFIADQVAAMRAEAEMRAVPLRDAVAIQVTAGLLAAEAITR